MFKPINEKNLSSQWNLNNFRRHHSYLAPCQGYYYRAKINDFRRSTDRSKIYITVYFIDYGNFEDVDMMDLKVIPEDQLYPPRATKVTLHDLVPEAYPKDFLHFFRINKKGIL